VREETDRDRKTQRDTENDTEKGKERQKKRETATDRERLQKKDRLSNTDTDRHMAGRQRHREEGRLRQAPVAFALGGGSRLP
jgi:hypothetical protein